MTRVLLVKCLLLCLTIDRKTIAVAEARTWSSTDADCVRGSLFDLSAIQPHQTRKQLKPVIGLIALVCPTASNARLIHCLILQKP